MQTILIRAATIFSQFVSAQGGPNSAKTEETFPLWLDVLHVSWRTIFLTVLVLVAVRLMGKRSVSNMAPFDLVVIIIMGSVAAIPMEEPTRLSHGVVPIVLLAAIQWLISWVSVRHPRAEKIIQGTPTELVRNGRILQKNMDKERISMTDLKWTLRENGISNVADVQQALLEPDGRVSIIKKQSASPLTPNDVYKLTLSRTDAFAEQSMVRLRNQYQEILARRSRRRT